MGLTQWTSSEYNLTNAAKTFTMFATCTRNLNGTLTRVSGFQQTVPANSSMTATADCPSGDIAVGGGYTTSVNTTTPAVHVPRVRTFGNLPVTTNPRRWGAKVFNGTTSNFAFVTAHANCLHLN